MKTALKLSLASLLIAAPAVHAVEINDNLSLSGFVDSSITSGDGSTEIGVDQVELNFDLQFDGISANIDLDDENGTFGVEQANFTVDVAEGVSLTAGKFLSYLGWETYDPTGLYQKTFAYGGLIPGHNTGVKIDYNGFGLAVLDSLGSAPEGSILKEDESLDNGNYGLELKYSFSPAEGWNVFIGYGLDKMDNADDNSVINLWASYETGIHTFAAEYNMGEKAGDDIDQVLVMWNAAITEAGSITARASINENAGYGLDGDFTKLTLAYLHSVNENLTLVAEVSDTDYDDLDNSASEIALEALFTF